MTDPALAARVDAARIALEPAAELALRWFHQLGALVVEHKTSGQDVVSRVDREVEELLRAALGAAFPDDGFLGEEYGAAEGMSGWVWIIDPIDGTASYLHGLADWCISIGLVRDGVTQAGLICAPCRDELFVAIGGGGATLNGDPIRVTPTDSLRTGLTGIGASAYSVPEDVGGIITRLLGAGGLFVRGGSGALALAQVACGRLVAYHETFMYVWDCVAGLALVHEAGGQSHSFLTADGRPKSGAVTAWAPQVGEALAAVLHPGPQPG